MNDDQKPVVIVPEGNYTALEVAKFLGLARTSVYALPDDELPAFRVGATRRARRYRGADVLAYRDRGRKGKNGLEKNRSEHVRLSTGVASSVRPDF